MALVGASQQVADGNLSMAAKYTWIIMGNDYPDRAFRSEAAAAEYVVQKQDEEVTAQRKGRPGRVYWRSMKVELV